MACALAWCGAVQADVDISEYESKSALSSSREQQRMRREIEAERAAEQAREARQAELEERQRVEAGRRQAQRPYGERLLEARCTACHKAANYETKRHSALGWRLVMLRMRYMNGAVIAPQEREAILAELMRRHGPGWVERVIEYGALVLALGVPPLFAWGGWRLMRRLRRRRPWHGGH